LSSVSETENLVADDEQIVAAKKQQAQHLRRILAIRAAREPTEAGFHAFLRYMMPDEEHPEDPTLSAYQDAPHAKMLREIVVGIYDGSLTRVGLSVPPQHGKTIHLSTYGAAWLLGLNPRDQIVASTYNETRAAELGEAFRAVLVSERYKAVFPEVELLIGSKSKTAMVTSKRGKVFFVGAGGTVTGRTARKFLVDDPIKDDEEAQSDTEREKRWKWLFSVAYSRGNKDTRIAVVHTRWHMDDMLGRLCDPNHPERKGLYEGVAEDWKYFNLSGVIDDPKLAQILGLKLEKQTNPRVVRAFGDKPCCALWAADKPLEYLAQWAIAEPRTFSALVMGKPSIESGEYFTSSDLVEYDLRDLPKGLRKYGASDHAVSEKQYRDFTVLGCVGIDDNDDIWVLPDIVWERMAADRTVEELLMQFQRHHPDLWWMEKDLISKSFGPFLHKRMTEERIYSTIDPIPPGGKDLSMRARAIQGRMRMGKVRFPRFAPWWSKGRSELLQFPYGVHDDFVSFMALIGLGLMKEGRATVDTRKPSLVVVGSPQWILQQSKQRALKERRRAANAGW
jgi:predicted phage terminase large subunit-like protein